MAHDQTASNLELLLASCEAQIERSETNNNQQPDDLNTSQRSDSSSSSVQFLGVHRPVRKIHPPARYAPYVDLGSALRRARLTQLQDQQQQQLAVPPAYPVRLNPVPEPHVNSFFTPGRPLAPYGWCAPSQNLQPQSQPNRSFGSQSVPNHRFAGNQGMGQPQATQSFDRMWNIPQPVRSPFDLANRGDGNWGLDQIQPAQAQQRPATPVSKSLNIAPLVEKTVRTPPRRSGRPSKASKNAKQPPTPHAGYPRCLEDALVCQPSSSATSVIIDGRPALVQFRPPADAPSTSTVPSAPRPRGRPRTKDRTSLASNNKNNNNQNPKKPPPMSEMRTPQLRSGQNPRKPPPMSAMKNPVPAVRDAPVPPPVMAMPAPVPQPPPIQPVVPPPGMTPEIIEAFMALLAQYLAYWRQPGVQAAGHIPPPAANH